MKDSRRQVHAAFLGFPRRNAEVDRVGPAARTRGFLLFEHHRGQKPEVGELLQLDGLVELRPFLLVSGELAGMIERTPDPSRGFRACLSSSRGCV